MIQLENNNWLCLVFLSFYLVVKLQTMIQIFFIETTVQQNGLYHWQFNGGILLWNYLWYLNFLKYIDNIDGCIYALQVGTKVFLKSWKNRNTNVALATIVSCDPTRRVGGVELGNEFLMVHVDLALAKSEDLIRPYKGYKIVGHVVGLEIAWSAIFVCSYLLLLTSEMCFSSS